MREAASRRRETATPLDRDRDDDGGDGDGGDDDGANEEARQPPPNAMEVRRPSVAGLGALVALVLFAVTRESRYLREGGDAAPPELVVATASAAATGTPSAPRAPVTGLAPERARPRVLLVSADSRRLPDAPAPHLGSGADEGGREWNATLDGIAVLPVQDPLSFMSAFAAGMEAYLERHEGEVDMIRYVYDEGRRRASKTCRHPTLGDRHASWCKLLAVRHALEDARAAEAEWLVWVDSDAFFTNVSATVEEVALRAGAFCGRRCRSPACAALLESAAIVTTCNLPALFESAMASVFFVRVGPEPERRARAKVALQAWWNVRQCASQFPWEQRALNTVLFPASDAPRGALNATAENALFRAVAVSSVAPNVYARGELVYHVGHTVSRRDRLSWVTGVLPRVGVSTQADLLRLHRRAQARETPMSADDLDRVSSALAEERVGGAEPFDALSALPADLRAKAAASECEYVPYAPQLNGEA